MINIQNNNGFKAIKASLFHLKDSEAHEWRHSKYFPSAPTNRNIRKHLNVMPQLKIRNVRNNIACSVYLHFSQLLSIFQNQRKM